MDGSTAMSIGSVETSMEREHRCKSQSYGARRQNMGTTMEQSGAVKSAFSAWTAWSRHRERLKLRLLGVGMSAFAAWLLWEGGGPWPVAVGVGVIEHWSREVMRKYEKDTGAIPDWITAVNLLANVTAAGLLITGLILTR